MQWNEVAWILLGVACAGLIGAGLYVGFFGLRAEQRRAQLIYTLTLFVYLSWVVPALLGIASGALSFKPERPALRILHSALLAVGFVAAFWVSGRYRGYVFRIIGASIGVLVGLCLGALLRPLLTAGSTLALLLPLALALALGAYGWQLGADVRAGWKITSFAMAGAGLAGSGATALIVAAAEGDPGGQLGEMILGAISTALKVAVAGVKMWEVVLSTVLWLALFVAGAAAQCRAHARAAPDEATLCLRLLGALRLRRGAT
jgi:hypothetical protein